MIEFTMMNACFGDTQEEVKRKMLAEQKPIGFCYDKDGQLYKLTKGMLGITTQKADNTVFAGNDAKEVKEGFEITLPTKIPLNILTQIISFFKSVCDDSGDEVFARIYYDKETGEYFPYVPEQKISKANVTYNITDERFQTEDRYLFVLDIHSHNTMSAFFSGTDNHDERTSGKVFMVVGQLDKLDIAYKIRTYQEPDHIEIGLFDAFEKPENVVAIAETEYGTFSYEIPEDELIKRILRTESEFPEEWSEQIKRISDFPSISHFYGSSEESSYHYNGGYSFGRNSYPKHERQLSLFGNDFEEDEKPISAKKIEQIGFDMDDEDDDLDIDFDQLSDEDKYNLAKDEIASQISDILEEVPDMDDPAFIQGLKEGLEEMGLDFLIKKLGEEGV